MKRIYTILIAVLLTATVWAQTPQKMTYQSVVRDDNSDLVTNTQVGLQIRILQGSATGTEVYSETQTPSTNANGLLTVEIGGQTGLDTITWANGSYFIETSIDPTGGSSYTITGTSQLLTVPYALHAKTAESIIGGINETDPVYTGSQAANITAPDISNLSNLSGVNTGDQDGSETKVTGGTNVSVTGTGTTADPYIVNSTTGSASNYVGELIGTNGEDGVVFYVDETGEHGLICSKTDVNAGSGNAWSNIVNVSIGGSAKSEFNGVSNSTAIIGQSGHTSSAAKLCADYSTSGTTPGDWYLPAIDELSQIYHTKYQINKALNTNSFISAPYWSSTEGSSVSAWNYSFSNGGSSENGKNSTYRVRAVRAF
jgi:Protein of unknown function (DUF1566)